MEYRSCRTISEGVGERMTKSMHLHKILRLMSCDGKLYRRKLIEDVNQDIKREINGGSSGGEFYTPFWALAKRFVISGGDMRRETAVLIDKHSGRRNIYPKLEKGFSGWWAEKRRWRNEPFSEIRFEPIYYSMCGWNIKIVNVLALSGSDASQRLIYPYWYNEPAVDVSIARLGLAVIDQSVNNFKTEELRLLDIIRGRSFSVDDVRLSGGETSEFEQRLKHIVEDWNMLRGKK